MKHLLEKKWSAPALHLRENNSPIGHDLKYNDLKVLGFTNLDTYNTQKACDLYLGHELQKTKNSNIHTTRPWHSIRLSACWTPRSNSLCKNARGYMMHMKEPLITRSIKTTPIKNLHCHKLCCENSKWCYGLCKTVHMVQEIYIEEDQHKHIILTVPNFIT